MYLRVIPYSTSSAYFGSYTVSVRQMAESAVLNFINPTASSTFAAGTAYSIQWTPDTAIFGQYVVLQLYREQNLAEAITSYTANSGTYSWTVPAGIASGSRYRIKLSSYTASYGSYAYSSYFTISGMAPDTFEIDDSASLAKAITTDSATQLRTITRGDVDWMTFNGVSSNLYVITVACSLSTYLRFYSSADLVTPLQTTTGALGSDARIVWFCGANAKYYCQVAGVSTTGFGNYRATVKACDSSQYRFRVLTPAAGASFAAGSACSITWNAAVGVGGTVDIFLYDSNNPSVPVLNIAVGVANSGSYSWTIPGTVTAGSAYYVKVISRLYSGIYGSSGVFGITK
jgi:hypothetical protein